jgi:hypothetical protein
LIFSVALANICVILRMKSDDLAAERRVDEKKSRPNRAKAIATGIETAIIETVIVTVTIAVTEKTKNVPEKSHVL